MIPGGDGLELCRRIRQTPSISLVPVIFLTARISESDKVMGAGTRRRRLHPSNRSARVRVSRSHPAAILRRFERPLAPAIVKAGEIGIDSGGMTLMVRGVLTQTTATEFRLAGIPGAASRAGIYPRSGCSTRGLAGHTHYVTPRSVDVYVRRIREKIEANPDEPRYLKTVRGAGYRFEVPKL